MRVRTGRAMQTVTWAFFFLRSVKKATQEEERILLLVKSLLKSVSSFRSKVIRVTAMHIFCYFLEKKNFPEILPLIIDIWG